MLVWFQTGDKGRNTLATSDAENLFTEIKERARALDPANMRQWFDKLTVRSFNGGSLEIACPEHPMVNFLKENCKLTFSRAAQQITGHLISVDFYLSNGQETTARNTFPVQVLKLHPDYTFENFVVGPSNRLAHASCVAISQSPGKTYNPLFVYGNSGLGKTHLLQAVCAEAKRKNHSVIIQFLSCENFVNRFIKAIQEGNLAGFQNQFRTVDLLVIDDVQFLREREQSQEEFFHTFNALYNNGKQILLSGDNPPNQIPSLEDRLISRFNWGLVARIDSPGYETRAAIVKQKAILRGLDISDEIAEYIAARVRANIRELEGAITTIYALAAANNEPVSLDAAQIALEGQIKLTARQINITDVINVVTAHFSVRLSDLQSKKRSQSITLPRQICMYLARNLTNHSLEEIGGHLGGRDHNTAMHACNKITQLKDIDQDMEITLNKLSKQIKQATAG